MPAAEPPPHRVAAKVLRVWPAPVLLLMLVPLMLCGLLETVFAESLRGFGTYWVYPDKLYKCDPGLSSGKISLDAKVTKFDVRKPNELQHLIGTVNLTTTFSDRNWAKITMDLDSGGRWKPNALVFRLNEAACSALKSNAPGMFHLLMGRRECPMPKGVIYVNGPVNWTFPKIPVLPFGHYRMHVTAGVAKNTDYCHIFESHVVPRKH